AATCALGAASALLPRRRPTRPLQPTPCRSLPSFVVSCLGFAPASRSTARLSGKTLGVGRERTEIRSRRLGPWRQRVPKPATQRPFNAQSRGGLVSTWCFKSEVLQ